MDAGIQRVSISLDGADAKTHDDFRKLPGSFDAAIRGIKNLRALGMEVQINSTIAKHNAHQVKELYKNILENYGQTAVIQLQQQVRGLLPYFIEAMDEHYGITASMATVKPEVIKELLA